ncbi:hypothetical protein AVEN_142336-1 [Araneus ventricosus]|uniref:Uncharacterized protein n=1 Tax=Araneus ventricosus TaxID=182803 RepID=A0A4Y2S7P8_ARAVE|nr:hypothetical protein AVEN_142336-1 [Araneus ventricosus]
MKASMKNPSRFYGECKLWGCGKDDLWTELACGLVEAQVIGGGVDCNSLEMAPPFPTDSLCLSCCSRKFISLVCASSLAVLLVLNRAATREPGGDEEALAYIITTVRGSPVPYPSLKWVNFD